MSVPVLDVTEAAIAKLSPVRELITSLKPLADLTVEKDGIGKVTEGRKEAKRVRIGTKKLGKELNEDALAHQRKVNAITNELIAEISVIEDTLAAREDAYELGKLREKEAKAREEAAAKAAILQDRSDRLKAAGCEVGNLLELGWLTAEEFETHLLLKAEEAKVIREREAEEKAIAERLRVEQEAEAKRQAEELRIRAEEIEKQRLIDEAAMREEKAKLQAEIDAANARQAEERKAAEAERVELARIEAAERKANEERLRVEREAIEKDRAEMRRQQEELAKQQAVFRAKAEAEAADQRRKAAEAEIQRQEAAAATELEKLDSVLRAMRDAAEAKMVEMGNPKWEQNLTIHFFALCEAMRADVRSIANA